MDVGTLRSNRKFNSIKLVNKKLKKRELIVASSTGVVVLKWKNTRDVPVHDATTAIVL